MSSGEIRSWIVQLRLKHWIKNFLIFIPYLLSHPEPKFNQVISLTNAFVSFSLVASAAYIFNDLYDYENDSSHPVKRKRPIAANTISKRSALYVGVLLYILGILMAISVDVKFLVCLLIYMLLNILYTLFLKEIAILDVLILSVFYIIRLIAGGVAVNQFVSYWLLVFSSFFFFSISLAKRFSEIVNPNNENSILANRRGYFSTDKEIILTLGVSSAFSSIVMLALYINDPDTSELYTSPYVLFGLLPIFMYWLSTLWFEANKGESFEDPVLDLFRHRKTILSLISISFILILAS